MKDEIVSVDLKLAKVGSQRSLPNRVGTVWLMKGDGLGGFSFPMK